MADNKKIADTSKPDKVDDELSALLDSALEDFKKPTDNTTPNTEPTNTTSSNSTKDNVPNSEDNQQLEEIVNGGEPNVEEWSEEFIRQAAAQFEASIATLLGENADGNQPTAENIQQKLQQMAEAAQQVIENPTINENTTDFASTISQTIQGLNAGAEGLQNPVSEQEIMNLFGGGDQNSFLPFMQGMMQSLLSKDVLYPSLKDILDKFPDWLNEHRATLSNEDTERYENQIKLMKDVCGELEKETTSDSVTVKNERFTTVLGLMQKLQEYGQPPTDLVGDVGPPLPPEIQTDPNQCSVM